MLFQAASAVRGIAANPLTLAVVAAQGGDVATCRRAVVLGSVAMGRFAATGVRPDPIRCALYAQRMDQAQAVLGPADVAVA